MALFSVENMDTNIFCNISYRFVSAVRIMNIQVPIRRDENENILKVTID